MESSFLEWDSSFFGKRISKIVADRSSSIAEIRDLMKKDAIDLSYIFSKDKLPGLEKEGAVLVDEKTTYAKKTDPSLREDLKDISSYKNGITDQLRNLALLSGAYSRFRIDKGLNHKFNELYTIWLTRSLNREIADEVFVHHQQDLITGFVTLRVINNICVIGLIAVDEGFQGLKIGTQLLKAVERWCLEKNIEKIEVATQGLNKQACVFYEKAGYTVDKIENIYHYYVG